MIMQNALKWSVSAYIIIIIIRVYFCAKYFHTLEHPLKYNNINNNDDSNDDGGGLWVPFEEQYSTGFRVQKWS